MVQDLRLSTINQTNVSFIIFHHLFSKESSKDKNIVLSPLSLQFVLSIIAAGSEGSTQEQLLDFLQSISTDQLNAFASHLVSVVLTDAAPAGGPLISFVNGAWIEQTLSLQPSFKEIVSTDFEANLSSVDFQNKAVEVTNEVNLWAEKETNGLIKELVPQGTVNRLTRLIFASALYFKGVWDDKFDVSLTKDDDFHLLNGSSVKVPFMTSKKKRFITEFNDFKVLGLPYAPGKDDREFSMYIFLPNAKDGLSALVEKMASETDLLDYNLLSKKVEVGDFRIPRFNISFGLETSDELKELGVVLPFSTGGLTNMVDSPVGQNLCVSNIFHKSFIEVNEEGIEAAAATAARIYKKKRRPSGIDFVADYPFLFVVREDSTGTILFVGQVFNPLAE